MKKVFSSLFVLLLLMCNVMAESGDKTDPVIIDGRLNDKIWADAAAVDIDGMAVKLAADKDNLYLAAGQDSFGRKDLIEIVTAARSPQGTIEYRTLTVGRGTKVIKTKHSVIKSFSDIAENKWKADNVEVKTVNKNKLMQAEIKIPVSELGAGKKDISNTITFIYLKGGSLVSKYKSVGIGFAGSEGINLDLYPLTYGFGWQMMVRPKEIESIQALLMKVAAYVMMFNEKTRTGAVQSIVDLKISDNIFVIDKSKFEEQKKAYAAYLQALSDAQYLKMRAPLEKDKGIIAFQEKIRSGGSWAGSSIAMNGRVVEMAYNREYLDSVKKATDFIGDDFYPKE